MRKSIAKQLSDAEIVIGNALSKPRLRKPLEAYGYDLKRIREGKALLENALMLQSAQKDEYGNQIDATDTLNEARQEAEAVYKKHLNLARMAFAGKRSAIKKLQLKGARARGIAGWLSQARIFYTNVMVMATPLESYGVTREDLATGQAMVEAVVAEMANQKDGKRAAQDSTRLRNEALEALNLWVEDFMTVARMAYRQTPQSLEALGKAMK
jgi:hypothetical protein